MSNNLKGLDANQVLRSVYDDVKNTLRVSVIDGSTGGGGGFEVIISHINDSIRLGNGTDYFTSTYKSSKIALDVNAINNVQLFTTAFDAITATYPTSTQEIYQSRTGGIAGSVVETLTVNYTDATKNFILNVERS